MPSHHLYQTITGKLRKLRFTSPSFIYTLLPIIGLFLLSSVTLYELRGRHTDRSVVEPADILRIPVSDTTHLDESSGMSSTLSQFLSSSRRAFLEAVRSKGDLKGWTLVMGNEAGDLDSIASSIAFAFLSHSKTSSSSQSVQYAPVSLTSRPDLHLRPENLLAFRNSSIDTEKDLLCLDDITSIADPKELGKRNLGFALVDHNRLGGMFVSSSGGGIGVEEADVRGVIDHHENEGFHKSADPRIIKVPTGSCASLVTNHFSDVFSYSQSNPEPVPAELADLLIAAILIDTGNLKPGPEGKAVDADRDAMSLLTTFSSVARAGMVNLAGTSSGMRPSEIILQFAHRHEELAAAKFNVGDFSSRDLFRRDYKEYTSSGGWKYGLSTVPVGLRTWISRPEEASAGGWTALLKEADAWMEERSLDVVGILTSFMTGQKSEKKGGKGKHGRELVLVIREGEERLEKLKVLFDRLPQSEVLLLRPGAWGEEGGEGSGADIGGRTRVWTQGNAKATRKQVAPEMKEVIESLSKK